MSRTIGSVALALSMTSFAVGEEIRLQGSTSAATALREMLMDGFTSRFADVQLVWESAGSGAAFVALFAGDADVGVVSRRVQREELELAGRLGIELREAVLALDALAVVVNPRNSVERLSVDQLQSLYAGRIVSWIGVGGADEPVRPLSVDESSGAPTEFRELVFSDGLAPFGDGVEYLQTSEDVIAQVLSDRGAIGFVSMSYERSRVRTVALETPSGNDSLPSQATVADGSYPLRSPLRIYTVSDPKDELALFLRFLYLHDGPALVASTGLVPVQAFSSAMRTSSKPRVRPDVSLTRIGFGFRGSRLSADARRSLVELASRLATSDETIWIAGHVEPTEARDGLADARARSCFDFLEQQNVDPSRMRTSSRGVSEPMASNGELAGRRLNRRADIWVLPQGPH